MYIVNIDCSSKTGYSPGSLNTPMNRELGEQTVLLHAATLR